MTPATDAEVFALLRERHHLSSFARLRLRELSTAWGKDWPLELAALGITIKETQHVNR
jgi:hypothetical protein